MMVRAKSSSALKISARRESPFAFRRIQDRELYQPSHDSETANRIRFRVRLFQSGRFDA